jgi:hypothetical protein
MMKPRRLVNIGLFVLLAIAIGAGAIAATSGGKTANTGNADACNTFWNWYDATTQVSSDAKGSTTPLLSAYKEATTQPLIDDLYNVSVGLRDQGKGLNGNKAANAAYANSAANLVDTDCSNAGYADPAS